MQLGMQFLRDMEIEQETRTLCIRSHSRNYFTQKDNAHANFKSKKVIEIL